MWVSDDKTALLCLFLTCFRSLWPLASHFRVVPLSLCSFSHRLIMCIDLLFWFQSFNASPHFEKVIHELAVIVPRLLPTASPVTSESAIAAAPASVAPPSIPDAYTAPFYAQFNACFVRQALLLTRTKSFAFGWVRFSFLCRVVVLIVSCLLLFVCSLL